MTHISTSFIFKYALGYVKIPHLGGGPVVDNGVGGPGGVVGPGGPYLHAIKRVGELKHLPAGVLKTLEWQLRKDLQEVEKVRGGKELDGILAQLEDSPCS